MSSAELLKTISTSLREASDKKIVYTNSKGKEVVDSINDFYRKQSAFSEHVLDISVVTLEQQFYTLLKTNTEVFNNLGDRIAREYSKVASREFRKNLIRIATIKGFHLKGSNIVFDTTGNNYKHIRATINEALMTTNAKDINTFLKFVSNKAGLPEITSDHGFDVGHIHSNVVSAYEMIVFNGLKQRLDSGDLTKSALASQAARLEKIMLDPNNVGKLMEAAGISNRALFESCVNTTISFAKSVGKGGLHAVLEVEANLDYNSISKIARSISDKVFPQESEENQHFGRTFERPLSEHLKTAVIKDNFTEVLKHLSGGAILNLKGSPSINDMALNYLELIIIGKTPEGVSSKTQVALKRGNVQITPFIQLVKPVSRKVLAPTYPVPRLRNPKGQFTSIVNIESLIRARLRATVEKNMVKPALVYRTGRFADSVKLQGVENRQGTLTAFLSYMKYPYATFEPGNMQGSKARSPSALIDRSVREIAKTIVTARMKTVIV